MTRPSSEKKSPQQNYARNQVLDQATVLFVGLYLANDGMMFSAKSNSESK